MTDVAIYTTLLTAINLIMYIKVSKFFGAMMILVTGMGILYKAPADGWIGFMMMASGFLLVIYSIMSDKKKRRR